MSVVRSSTGRIIWKGIKIWCTQTQQGREYTVCNAQRHLFGRHTWTSMYKKTTPSFCPASDVKNATKCSEKRKVWKGTTKSNTQIQQSSSAQSVRNPFPKRPTKEDTQWNARRGKNRKEKKHQVNEGFEKNYVICCKINVLINKFETQIKLMSTVSVLHLKCMSHIDTMERKRCPKAKIYKRKKGWARGLAKWTMQMFSLLDPGKPRVWWIQMFIADSQTFLRLWYQL